MADESIVAATRFEVGELDLVFIDGAHDYDSVLADLKAWEPKVKAGGIFAGHDIDSPEVQRALEDAGIEYHVVGRCWVRKNQENADGLGRRTLDADSK
jgi:predicted O-methyltransferase YrrM